MEPGRPNDRFTPETRNVIATAKRSVMEYRHTHITPEHILMGILSEKNAVVEAAFRAANATPDQIRELVKHHQRPGDEEAIPEHLVTFSERAKRVIEAARTEAQRARVSQIGPEHLLLGLTMVPNTVCGAVLRAVELTTEKVREALAGQ
jgi:ATP-dependent Clp protease ATP-binding subunit ClpA